MKSHMSKVEVGFSEYYSHYRSKGGTLPYYEWQSILKEYIHHNIDKFGTTHKIDIPPIGYVVLNKHYHPLDKPSSRKPIDWKHWNENKEVKFFDEDYYYKWKWVKNSRLSEHMQLYTFHTVRTFKRMVGQFKRLYGETFLNVNIRK